MTTSDSPPGTAGAPSAAPAAPHSVGAPPAAPVIVGISGSSGALLAVRTVEVLGELGIPMHITYTRACRQVWP
ncbi:MAG: hypothetical protein ACRDHP_20830, partial [Ktedonobacterales bacterium]